MTSDPSNYHREYSPYGSYSLVQFEGSDVISVLKNSIEYSFVFFKCLFLLDRLLSKNQCLGFLQIGLMYVLFYLTVLEEFQNRMN